MRHHATTTHASRWPVRRVVGDSFEAHLLGYPDPQPPPEGVGLGHECFFSGQSRQGLRTPALPPPPAPRAHVHGPPPTNSPSLVLGGARITSGSPTRPPRLQRAMMALHAAQSCAAGHGLDVLLRDMDSDNAPIATTAASVVLVLDALGGRASVRDTRHPATALLLDKYVHGPAMVWAGVDARPHCRSRPRRRAALNAVPVGAFDGGFEGVVGGIGTGRIEALHGPFGER